jgi:hypothetical protein
MRRKAKTQNSIRCGQLLGGSSPGLRTTDDRPPRARSAGKTLRAVQDAPRRLVVDDQPTPDRAAGGAGGVLGQHLRILRSDSAGHQLTGYDVHRVSFAGSTDCTAPNPNRGPWLTAPGSSPRSVTGYAPGWMACTPRRAVPEASPTTGLRDLLSVRSAAAVSRTELHTGSVSGKPG